MVANRSNVILAVSATVLLPLSLLKSACSLFVCAFDICLFDGVSCLIVFFLSYLFFSVSCFWCLVFLVSYLVLGVSCFLPDSCFSYFFFFFN